MTFDIKIGWMLGSSCSFLHTSSLLKEFHTAGKVTAIPGHSRSQGAHFCRSGQTSEARLWHRLFQVGHPVAGLAGTTWETNRSCNRQIWGFLCHVFFFWHIMNHHDIYTTPDFTLLRQTFREFFFWLGLTWNECVCVGTRGFPFIGTFTWSQVAKNSSTDPSYPIVTHGVGPMGYQSTTR